MAITTSERATFRLTVAHRETPRALALTGACFVAITMVNALVGPPLPVLVLLLNGSVAVLILAAAALSRTGWVRAGGWPWIAAGCAVALVLDGLVQVWRKPDGSAFAYVLLIVLAYAPLTLAWLPASVAAVPMLIGCAIVARQWPADEAVDWVIASVSAVAIGMGLMWLRLRSIYEMAELTEQVRALAARDQLTGALNRHGVEERVPELVGTAMRRGEPVFATFLDIVGLKGINDRHGHEAGDQAIVAVAGALRALARPDDLVGRWGGDEFVILGLGTGQDADRFASSLRSLLGEGWMALTDAPLDVSVGAAHQDSAGLDLEGLIARADADMYARRRQSGQLE